MVKGVVKMRSLVSAAVLLLISGLISNAYSQSEIAGAWPQLVVEAPEHIGEGRQFEVNVNLENAVDIAGFAIALQFNDDVIRAEGVIEGPFLSYTGPTHWGDPDIDNRDGEIKHIVCVVAHDGGRTGDGTLFTAVFEAHEPGTSPINIDAFELSDSQMRSVTANVHNVNVTVTDVPEWDTNADGCTDLFDLVFVGQHFGDYVPSPIFPNPDVDGSGRVDIADLILVIRHYGDGCTSVPAPPKPGSEAYRIVRKALRSNRATSWGRIKAGH